MAKISRKTGATTRSGGTTKYDAHNNVLAKTYGAQADLRRELADSKSAVAERTEILKIFSECADSQRAWLLLEDYFEKLSLSRKDFSSHDWWPRLMSTQGKKRLEETAILFLRANRPVPTELQPHTNLDRFAEIEQAEKEQQLVQQLEHWLFPHAPTHLDAPRATMRIICEPKPVQERLPLLIGGGGEQKTLRTVARYADYWHGHGTPEVIAHKLEVLAAHCADVGRDVREIKPLTTVRPDVVLRAKVSDVTAQLERVRVRSRRAEPLQMNPIHTVDALVERCAALWRAGARGFIDAIVYPEETRDVLAMALRTSLQNKGPHLGAFVLPPHLGEHA